jgi:hypothetical protein
MALLSTMISGMPGSTSAQARTEDKNDRLPASQRGEVFPKPIDSLVGLANGSAGDGTELSISVYVTSEGTQVNTVHGHFKSKAAAKAELERQLKQEDKIVERAPRKTPLGKVVGERVIVRFAATQGQPNYSAVLLTDGRDYYEITSSSIDLAIDMAKSFENIIK